MNLSQPAIELDGVGVLRGGRWIVDDVTAQVPAGACAAVLGPNGCGKSTLLRVVSGYVWPARGAVRVLGERFGDVDVAALRRSIRLVQANGVAEPAPEASITDVALTGFFGTAGLYDPVTGDMRDIASAELRRVGLTRVAGHAFGTLSSGERM